MKTYGDQEGYALNLLRNKMQYLDDGALEQCLLDRETEAALDLREREICAFLQDPCFPVAGSFVIPVQQSNAAALRHAKHWRDGIREAMIQVYARSLDREEMEDLLGSVCAPASPWGFSLSAFEHPGGARTVSREDLRRQLREAWDAEHPGERPLCVPS